MNRSIACGAVLSALLVAWAGRDAGAADAPAIGARTDDHLRFPSARVAAPTASRALAMAPADGVRLPRALEREGRELAFDDALRDSGTLAWIVLRDGRIADERYYDGGSRERALPSFSVAKSLVGALTAVAQARGELADLDAAVVDALPELADADRGWSRATWRHLLDMRSGARFDEDYSREDSDVGRLYAGDGVAAQALAVTLDARPGRAFRYRSIDTQLLALGLERRVGRPVAEQLAERIWQPMGAEAPAAWTTDAADPPAARAFCCLVARPIDFARFGQLVLDRGMRDGVEILPAAWIDGLLAAARKGDAYAGQWWLLHDPRSGPTATALLAEGVLGQYVFVHPHARLVIVRMGRGEGGLPWRTLFGAIAANNPPD